MKELICIVCPKGCHLKVDEENNYAVTGNACPRGAEYGAARRCPVKTNGSIPKGLLFEAMRVLDDVELTAPVKVGQVVVADLLGTGVDVVATKTFA